MLLKLILPAPLLGEDSGHFPVSSSPCGKQGRILLVYYTNKFRILVLQEDINIYICKIHTDTSMRIYRYFFLEMNCRNTYLNFFIPRFFTRSPLQTVGNSNISYHEII